MPLFYLKSMYQTMSGSYSYSLGHVCDDANLSPYVAVHIPQGFMLELTKGSKVIHLLNMLQHLYQDSYYWLFVCHFQHLQHQNTTSSFVCGTGFLCILSMLMLKEVPTVGQKAMTNNTLYFL